MKSPKDRLQRAVVIGATPSGIAAANKLGELGIAVTLVDSDANLDKKLSVGEWRLASGVPLNYAHRAGLIRILRNPRIDCVLPAQVTAIRHNRQGFSVNISGRPIYVDPDRCVLCGRCVDVCPVEADGEKAVEFEGRSSLPGRPVIDKRRLPLCRENCPLGVNAQGYVALAKAGKYAEALALIREKNVLPGICGRICNHPCESECRRGELDEAVSIRAIKRFLADYEAKNDIKIEIPEPAEKREEKFAVIGSGPAGLAAAAELAKRGCQVRVFEKEDEAGGLLRYGIGPHRLPREILDAELDYIRKLGVEFVTAHDLDLATGPEKLGKEYDGVIIATGSWKDKFLGVDGEDLDGVVGCLSFLGQAHRGDIQSVSGKVAVIGDGNAAYDLARTLSRLGAKVTIVSWFGKDKIPADPEEIRGAEEEGIETVDNTRVVAFSGKNGKFKHLVCHPTQPGPADKNGIEWPVIVENSKPFELKFDKAFVAIGQAGPYKPAKGLKVNDYGFIQTDDDFKTNIPGVYAAGDASTGPSTVVRAMADGKSAAEQVLRDVCKITIKVPTRRPGNRDFPDIPAHVPAQNRAPMPEKQSSLRKDFSEVELGLSEAQVMFEAERCLQCGVCSECLQCLDVCREVGAIRHDSPEEEIMEQAGVVIIADPELAPAVRGDDVIRAYGPKSSKPDVYAMIMRGYAAAAQAMGFLGASHIQKGHGVSFTQPESELAEAKRIGVFVCRCNDSLGWSDDLDRFVSEMAGRDDVVHAEVIVSACIPEGVSEIIKTVREKGLTRIALGACACCSLNFACSACTDQRSRLKHNLFTATGISRSMVVTNNIRGEALSLLRKDPAQAMEKFEGLLSRSVRRAKALKPFPSPVRNYNFAAAVVGESEAAVHSALTLAKTGMDVFMFSNGGRTDALDAFPNVHFFEGAAVKKVTGTLGDFKVDLENGESDRSVHVGAVILGEKSRKRIAYVRQDGMRDRGIICAMQKKDTPEIPFFYPGMTAVSGLFVADAPGVNVSKKQKGEAAAVLAAAVMPRGPRKSKGYTVVIDKEVCRSCGRCMEKCPYQAVTMHDNGIGGWYAAVDEAFCKGCGNCISVCPSNAADSPYRSQKFFEQTLEDILQQ